MNERIAGISPALAAQLDWMSVGTFYPERFTGAERTEYNRAAEQIERQYDEQPE